MLVYGDSAAYRRHKWRLCPIYSVFLGIYLSIASAFKLGNPIRGLTRQAKSHIVSRTLLTKRRTQGTIQYLSGRDSISQLSIQHPMKVAFQGESGAYSEKAARELLGTRIVSVPYESFEDTFKAVASRDVDYACVPIENSLGGSIHTNFDLLMRYDLHIVAEHEFRVEHALLALPGVKLEDIKKVMSHPQALAQCDEFLRSKGLKPVPEYDTAGSAKMISDNNWRDCAAVASDLAASTYGLEVIQSNIEDHDNNFTRFLLLSRQPVSSFIPPKTAAKTSIVFVLPNTAGALYKALACFTLRDIDFCKIESRPTSARLLQFLQFKEQTDSNISDGNGDNNSNKDSDGDSGSGSDSDSIHIRERKRIPSTSR